MYARKVSRSALALAFVAAAAGCALSGRPYVGTYQVPGRADARSEALDVAHLLAARLGVQVATAEEGTQDVFVILRSAAAASPDVVSVTVEWVSDDPDRFSVVLRKRDAGDTPEVEAVRRAVEEVLRSRSGRWSFEVSD